MPTEQHFNYPIGVRNKAEHLKLEIDKLFMTPFADVYTPIKDFYLMGYKEALSGQSDVFFHDWHEYLRLDETTLQNLAIRGRRTIEHLALNNGWKKQKSLDYIKPLYHAYFQSFEDFAFIGINTTTEENKFAIYTRNYDLLLKLESLGVLFFHPDKDKILSALCQMKTNNGVLEGELPLIRLDILQVKDGVPYFTAKVPRSNLQLQDYYFIPTTSIYQFLEMLSKLFNNKVFRFTKDTQYGEKTYIGTFDPNIVEQVYKGVDDESAFQRKLRSIRTHYDIATNRIRVYDLEAPVTELGVVTFRPEMLNRIQPIQPTELDRSKHNLDLNFSYPIFKTRIMQCNVEQVNTLTNIMPDLHSYATLKDKQKALIEWGSLQRPQQLYQAMLRNRQIFPDLNSLYSKRQKSAPKYLKNYSTLNLPPLTNEEEVKQTIRQALYNGVVRFMVSKKDGTTYQRIGTNNPKILQDLLGKNYIRLYESPRARLREFYSLLKNNKVRTAKKFFEGVQYYDISEYLMLDFIRGEYNDTNNFSPEDDQIILSRAVRALELAITQLKDEHDEREFNRRTTTQNVVFRNPYTTSQKDYFQTISIDKIISVEHTEIPKQ